MSKTIHLGTVKVPIENYATQANAILGIKGSGKTETAKGVCEQLLDHGIPIVVFDPSGVWRFLKVPKSAGGKAYKIVVAGGQAADLPLTPHTAPEILRSAMRANIPLVIDMFDIKLSKSDWRRIVEQCMGILLYENVGMRHVILEEAAEFAPQQTKDSISYAAVEKLVRMGGNSSVGITLINQRAQEVNKAVLELCELLVLQRQKGSHAMAAIEKWVTMADDFKNVAKTIAAFGAGEALVWPEASAPIHTQFPRCITFHPDRKKPDLPKGSMPENVSEFVSTLKGSLGKIEAEMKANDPAELKKRIAVLEQTIRKLEANPVAKSVEVEKRVEVPVLTDEEREMIEDAKNAWSEARSALSLYEKLIEKLTAIEAHINRPITRAGIIKGVIQRQEQILKSEFRRVARPSSEESSDLPKGEKAILTTIAQFDAQGAVTREQLTVMTGYKRSSRDTYIQRLREKGLVAETGEGLTATVEGVAALGSDFRPLPTGDKLREHWLQRLPQGEGAILEILIGAHPDSVDRESLSKSTGYQRSSRDTYLQRLGARMLVNSVGRGAVKASDILFD